MGFGNYYGGYMPPMGGNFGGAMQDNLSQYRAAQAQNQQNMSGAVWVQGEVGAKSYPVAPGNSVVLMDSEAARFYIKTADISGVPMPLRVFEFKELGGASTPTADMSQFVTKEELQEALSKLKGETENV